jgi:lipoate-protein ligase A
MKYLELTFAEPGANLACDDALLERMEADSSMEACLRVWQANEHFVVLGHSNRLLADVNIALCNQDRIPVLRRVSGGGTVMQGPGCLNYSLLLRGPAHHLKTIAGTFRHVLQRHCLVVNELCRAKRVRIQGISDLTIDGLKFSGNAQYRKSTCVLVHGTFLINFDLATIARYLTLPARQPAYREGRPHLQFVTNLEIDAAELRAGLKAAWQATDGFFEVPFSRIDALVKERYQRREWSEKF